MSPPTYIIIPLHSKVVDPTSTPSHCSRSSSYDCRILPLLDVMAKAKAKGCIEHFSDQEEEGMEDNKARYGASMHGSPLYTLNMLIVLWTLICVSSFLLYFHLCPKTSISKLFAIPPSLHYSNIDAF